MTRQRCYRRVLQITGDDSPNVRYAKEELRAGRVPSNRIVLEGVLPWADYEKRRLTWDPIRQSIGLDAKFWEGAEVLLYPPDWLDRAHRIAIDLRTRLRKGEAMGVDPAEGGDSSAYTVVDKFGVVEQFSEKTPNTTKVVKTIKAMIAKHGLDPRRVCLDRGGGGKPHADRLREEGFPVRTIDFGGPVLLPETRSKRARADAQEDKYVYKNKRAAMFGRIREFLDPASPREPCPGFKGFGIPPGYVELRRQMAPIPLLYDGEGRMFLPPKEKPTKDYEGVTLRQICGCSPDELDSLALALEALEGSVKRFKVGGMPA